MFDYSWRKWKCAEAPVYLMPKYIFISCEKLYHPPKIFTCSTLNCTLACRGWVGFKYMWESQYRGVKYAGWYLVGGDIHFWGGLYNWEFTWYPSSLLLTPQTYWRCKLYGRSGWWTVWTGNGCGWYGHCYKKKWQTGPEITCSFNKGFHYTWGEGSYQNLHFVRVCLVIRGHSAVDDHQTREGICFRSNDADA